jgi:predicted nucleic acid-binding protein
VRRLFADSGYWIALLNPQDGLHAQAKASADPKCRIFTTDAVLVEVLNAFCGAPNIRAAAVRMVKMILQDANLTVVPATRDRFMEALSDYEGFHDKEWSHTDCLSFKVMRENDIAEALAHDHHFEQAGFRALLR